MELLEALKSGPALYAAIAATVATLLKAVKGLMEFHDEHLQKRNLKKLAFLADGAKDNEMLLGLIAGAREEEVFRTIIGRTASPQFIAALGQLWNTGKFSLAELRAAQSYLTIDEGRVLVPLGWFSSFILYVSLSAVVIMGVYIAAVVAPLLRLQALDAYAAIALILAAYFLFAWFIGRDARAVLVARSLKAKIEALPAPVQAPNENPAPTA